MQIKQLKHQLEDQAQATQIALKSKKQQEVEIQEIQAQYEAMVRSKTEVTKRLHLSTRLVMHVRILLLMHVQGLF